MLVVEFFCLVIGLLYWGVNLSKEKRGFQQLENRNKERSYIQNEFQKLLVDSDQRLNHIQREYLIDTVFRNQCDTDYKNVIKSLDGNIKYLSNRHVMFRLSPYIHLMKKYGKLPNSAGAFHAVFQATSIGDIKGCAILLKWFDNMVRYKYPQYYIVKYYDSLLKRYIISWNIYISDTSTDIVPLSYLQGNDIHIGCIDL